MYQTYNKQGKVVQAASERDIVEVTRQSKIRPFPGQEKAPSGMVGLVVSSFTNKYGTHKVVIINEEGKEFTQAGAAVNVLSDLSNEMYKEVWTRALRNWMEITYVPAFIFHKYDHHGYPQVWSRDKSACLVTTMRDKEFWINMRHIHVDDIQAFKAIGAMPNAAVKRTKRSEMKTVRIPVWIADKNGLFGPKNSI